jgi:predicted naringenin-chalcone synthase
MTDYTPAELADALGGDPLAMASSQGRLAQQTPIFTEEQRMLRRDLQNDVRERLRGQMIAPANIDPLRPIPAGSEIAPMVNPAFIANLRPPPHGNRVRVVLDAVVAALRTPGAASPLIDAPQRLQRMAGALSGVSAGGAGGRAVSVAHQ